MEVSMLVVGSVALLGFALGALSGTWYALRSVRRAIEGTKRVRR